MKTTIEIHCYDFSQVGKYIVWYSDNGRQCTKRMTHEEICLILTKKQEEDFFLNENNKYKFKIKSEYDFKKYILNQEI